jgi:ribose transport system permease protein
VESPDPAAVASGAAAGDANSGRPARRLQLDGTTVQRFALPAIWVLVIVVFGAVEPSSFLSTANFSSIFGTQATLVVLTLGLLLPLTTGDYDLSVASNLGFSAMIVASLNVNEHMPIVWSIVVAIAAGLGVGFLNGLFVVGFGVSSFIVTLGTGTILTGLALAVSHQLTIGGVSSELVGIVDDKALGLSHSFYFAMVVTILLWYVLDFTPVGRRLLFVGHGPDVARLGGIAVNRLRWGALTLAGGLSAVAGVLNVGTVGAADPTSSAGFLLPAYAAAFLGATTISPGRFNPWGTVVTVYFLVTGFTGLELLGVPPWVEQVFYGCALVLAVTLAQLASRRRQQATT